MERMHEDEASIKGNVPTLRLVALRGDGNPYTVSIPVRNGMFSLVLPNGYVSWPAGKPYPESIRVSLEHDTLWVNFGFSREFGFYVSLKAGKNGGRGVRSWRNTG